MYLHAVEAALAGKIDCLAELLHHILDFRYLETAMDSRRIEIKAVVGADRHTMTSLEVRHIAAMPQLDADFGSFGMNSVSHLLQFGYDLIMNIELAVKRDATQVHCAIGDSSHTNSAMCDADVIILQFLRRTVAARHVFEGSAANEAITQRNRSQLIGSKQFVIIHYLGYRFYCSYGNWISSRIYPESTSCIV